MTELEQKRIKAVQLYVSGKKVCSICKNLNKSRKWFINGKNIYDSGNKNWFKNRSRSPKNPVRINEDIEKLVIKIRKELMEEKYALIGPQTIHWELKRLGVKPPSLSTIKRIIKRNNLIVKKSKYHKKGTPYPTLPICGPNVVHQVDFGGPRYITGDGRFYSFNIMDVYTRRTLINPNRYKRGKEALAGIIKACKQLGEPDYIQFDNALSFRGSTRYPRSFGIVIRWCLYNGIQPIFIPVSEPWRNGYIEKFNEYHNNNYHYSPLGGKTPNEIFKRDCLTNKIFKDDYKISSDLPITDGFIHIIRLIRSDLKLNIFGETFKMPKTLKYEYVVATICTDSHIIRIYDSKWNSLFTIPYSLPVG